MSEKRCTWDAERGWLTPEHLRDCTATDCRGCKPCPATHCAMRGRCASHVEPAAGIYTCPSCIGQVRRDLATIVELHAIGVRAEAEEAGVDSEAFNLVGPAASNEQLAGRDRLRGWCEYPRADDDGHPYAVLGRWDLALRETYGPYTDLFVTVASAADYLTGLLAGPFPHGSEFETFAAEIAECRSHLEDVIHDSRRPEEGARCPRCGEADGKGPRLRKRYGRHAGLKPGEVCATKERTGTCPTCDGDEDIWICPADPEHRWDEVGYRARIATTYVEHATALTVPDLAERLDVPESTIRRWASTTNRKVGEEWVEIPPRLRPAGRSEDGRKVYRVADVETLIGRGACKTAANR